MDVLINIVSTALAIGARLVVSRRLLQLILALSLFTFGAPKEQTGTVDVYQGIDIQSEVNSHPGGTRFLIHPGLYRLTTAIRPRNGDQFVGQVPCAPPKSSCPAILNGSRLLTSFKRSGGDYETTGQKRKTPILEQKHCEPDHSLCNHPEDLYLDSKPLIPVSSAEAVGTGTWFFDDSTNAIYLHDNPANHVAEIGQAFAAFDASTASNVVIKNLTVEKFASQVTFAAIGTNELPSPEAGANWVVEDNEIRLNHGDGVRINFGWHILNNYIHHNGNLGIGGGMGPLRSTRPSGVVIQANEISYNNYAHVKPGFGAGGVKILLTRGLVFRNNYVHNNEGSGFHADTDNIDLLVDGNTISDNTEEGAFVEVSYSGTVRNNKLLRNGYIYPNNTSWLYDANLLSSTSQSVEAYCNTIEIAAQGGNGMDIIAQPRRGYSSRNNFFHHNSVSFDGKSGTTGGAGADPGEPDFYSVNLFDYDGYHLPDVRRPAFSWRGKKNTFAEFRAAGQESHGTIDGKYKSTAPFVVISSPSDGALVSGNVGITGETRTSDGQISKVEFYVDWSLQSTATGNSFNFVWNTANVSTGQHTVAVSAYNADAVGACYAITAAVGR